MARPQRMDWRAAAAAAGLAAAAANPTWAGDAGVEAELRRLAERVGQLEQQAAAQDKALAAERVSEQEPELVTRLKAVEFQALSMQKQARQIEALEGITVGASLLGVVQRIDRKGAASGVAETRANYRGDVSVTLPGGEVGDSDGKIFAHFRFGQGNGVAPVATYTGSLNTTAFQVAGAAPDDSFGVLAQAWYQLTTPLAGDDGQKANARRHLAVTAGKIDPFVFFDQNAAADDESAKFLNNVFVHNPLLDSGGDIGADAYGFTPGLIGQYMDTADKGGEWGVSVGVFGSSGAQANNGANFNGPLAKPLLIAQLETAARIAFLPGHYRLYAWSNGRGVDYDGQEARHAGFGLSTDQRVDDDVLLFARFGRQSAGRVRFDRAVTVGAEIGGALWRRSADSLGIAFADLRSATAYRADSGAIDGYSAGGGEQHAEVYYRYRVNGSLELSPDLQWVRHPAAHPDAPPVRAVALRARIGF